MRERKKRLPESTKKERKRYVLKTSIDVLVGGLISIGIFQSPTFILTSGTSYIGLLLLLLLIFALMLFYSIDKDKFKITMSLILMIGLSFLEVILIGILLNESIELILVVWFIVIPSVILFDNLLN